MANRATNRTLEQSAASGALTRRFAELSNKPNATMQDIADSLNAEDSFNKYANQTIEEIGAILGAVFWNIHLAFDLDKILLGGGVVEAIPTLVVEVKKCIIALADTTEIRSPEIIPASLGNKAGFIGAALLPNSLGAKK